MVNMENLEITPSLIKELHKFEAKKTLYMTEAEKRDDENQQTKHSFKYYFQHPNFRLLTIGTLVVLNFYMFAEDPVRHSVTESKIAVIGNIFSLLFTNYPDNGFSALKVFLWLFAIVFGVVVGKLFVHYYLLCHKLQLKIFSKDGQGSLVVILFFTVCTLYYQSFVYNAFLIMCGNSTIPYQISSNMHVENKTFMKWVAVIVWSSDLLTAWMILDVMLQEKRYGSWLKPLKTWWNTAHNRVIVFWFMTLTIFLIFTIGITTDFVNWNTLSNGFASTNELARSFLASVIVILDVLVVMQDWDFPHFNGVIDIKPPGIPTTEFSISIPSCMSYQTNRIEFTGKWLYYGLLSVIMMHDMYMWKKQIFYQPFDYGQYTDREGRIYTVTDKKYLLVATESSLTYQERWKVRPVINSTTNETFILGKDDHMTLPTYHGYSYSLKALAFIPTIIVLSVFSLVTYSFAKKESEHEKQVWRWYEGKYIKKRKKLSRVHPIQEESDSDSEKDDEIKIITMENSTSKFDYVFQHPIPRLMISYIGVFLSWLLIAEDPIGHSLAPAKVDVLGNAYSLIFGSYPSKEEYASLKVMMWICALVTAIIVGKLIIYELLFNAIFKIKLFSKGQGLWICLFLTFTVSLYVWSLIYNEIILEIPELHSYKITNEMNITFKTFMKGVATMSFLTHFILTLMITDTVMQEQHYPEWGSTLRKYWRKNYVRIPIVWVIGVTITSVAITAITVDYISWDNMSMSFTAANELGRAWLSAFIVVFDVLIITQDWEFPRFTPNPNINLPGLPVANYTINLCCIKIVLKGKWFTYGLLGLLLIIDIYNLKNQLTYEPITFEQYTYAGEFIHTINNPELFIHGKKELLAELKIYGDHFKKHNSKYHGYNKDVKGIAILPIVLTILGSITFGVKRSMQK